MTTQNQWIYLMRDCEALLIPSGTPVTLQSGEQVLVTQSLGDSFTVQVGGNLARIEGKDADAIGRVPPEQATLKTNNKIVGDGKVDEPLIWAQLRNCYDPEIPVNIVDLGLIYKVDIIDSDPPGHAKVDIEIGLTLLLYLQQVWPPMTSVQ